MPTPNDDPDALFEASVRQSAEASAPPSSTLTPGPSLTDIRRESRVKVAWPARVQLAGGRVVELRLRDITEGGLGLSSEVALPLDLALPFALGVPAPDKPKQFTAVTGTVRATYSVLQGRALFIGAVWVSLPAEGRELIGQWIQRLRR